MRTLPASILGCQDGPGGMFQPEHHKGCCVMPKHHHYAHKWWHDVPESQGHCQSKVHTVIPGKCPYQATIIWQLDGPVHQVVVDPAPVMVEQTARMMHVVRKLKAIKLGQHWRRFPTANIQVSNVLDSSFWETRDAERRE